MRRLLCDCRTFDQCPQGRTTRCTILVEEPWPRRMLYRRADGTDCLVTIRSAGEPPVIQELGRARPIVPAAGGGPAWSDIAGALEAVLDQVQPGLRPMLEQAIRELRAPVDVDDLPIG